MDKEERGKQWWCKKMLSWKEEILWGHTPRQRTAEIS